MPTATIKLAPGVDAELTPSLNQAAYQTTNLIRWSPSGLPEKLGGWTKFYPVAIDSPIRALHGWEDTSGILHLGVGAEDQLSIITDGVLQDVTPLIEVYNITPSFTTVSGSTTVIVNNVGSDPSIFDTIIIATQVSVGGIVLYGPYPVTLALSNDSYEITAASPATASVTDGGAVPVFATTNESAEITVTLDDHGYAVNDTFPVLVPTTIAGLTLSGFYPVESIIDANNFTIFAANQANATTTVSMNGGDVQIQFYAVPAPLPLATGYGIGGYGDGGYGTGQVPGPAVGSPITVTDWTLDNWGSFLAACANDGPIFIWQPNTGLGVAGIISQAPTINTGMFVSMPQQIMIAYGASVLGVQDPLLIAWCNAGDFTVWVASTTNLAGTYRIPKGSAIIGAMQGPQYALVWTDIDLWSMSFIGYPFVFSFNELATGCGLIAKFAATILGTTVYWMSQKGFFAVPAGGGVVPLPCSVWDVIFQQLDTSNLPKIRAASNSQFGEVEWFFPVKGGTGENSMYVKFTPQFNAWDYGTLERSAWIDQSVFGPPIGASPGTNLIYQHETSPDADGQILAAYFSTGYWALSDGEDIVFCDQAYPDFRFGFFGGTPSATVNITFSYADYAQSTVYSTPTYVCTSGGLSFLNPRFRGRLAAMTVSSDDLGTWWRLGGIRMRTAPDGKL